MEDDHDVLLILGRPFLATGSLIDVHNSELTLKVKKEEVIFNIYRSMKFPDEAATCHQIDIVRDYMVKTQLSSIPIAPLERCLTS